MRFPRRLSPLHVETSLTTCLVSFCALSVVVVCAPLTVYTLRLATCNEPTVPDPIRCLVRSERAVVQTKVTSSTDLKCFFALRDACRGTSTSGCMACATQHANSLIAAGCTNDDIRAECNTGHLVRMNVSISTTYHPMFIIGLHTFNGNTGYDFDSYTSAPTMVQDRCVEYSPSPNDIYWYLGTSVGTGTTYGLPPKFGVTQEALQLKGTPDIGPLGNTSKFELWGLSGDDNGGVLPCLPNGGCLATTEGQNYTLEAGESITFQNGWQIDFHGFCKEP